jgi:hypothetical protein
MLYCSDKDMLASLGRFLDRLNDGSLFEDAEEQEVAF